MATGARSARLKWSPPQPTHDRMSSSAGGFRGRAARQERSASLVADLEAWMRAERAKLSRHAAVAKAMDYMLTRWEAFTRFLDDGRICLTNNAAERALRGLALGRKSWLFAGSEREAARAALMYTLIQTAKLNDVDPQARRRPRPHRRHAADEARRAAPMELAPRTLP
jgi:transposase